jgi:hypothetical protein
MNKQFFPSKKYHTDSRIKEESEPTHQRERDMRSHISGIVIFFVLLGAGWAQVSTSRIEGIVTDNSGAVIPGASVKITNEGTDVSHETTTSSSGTYVVPSLTPGQYSVTVTSSGFQTYTTQHNALSIGAPLVVNATLTVGGATQVVEVESSYQRIETTNATVSDVMTTEQVKNLPLNGRNPLSLLTLEPGVTQRPNSASGSGTHVFGSRDRSHNVTIDGIDANESTVPNPQTNLQRLNPDNVQEFRTITLDATAEQGRNSGANVIIGTKSGTNALHGDVFYFNRNTDYNANEWFNNATGKARPVLDLHQWGFDVGGPIIKNKTFFFGSYQGNKISQTQPIAATGVGIAGFGSPTTYTALARQGLFRFVRGTINVNGKSVTQSSPLLVDSSGNLLPGVPVCNGTTVTGNCVDTYNLFANDPSHIGPDPSVAGLLNKLPLPNNFTLGTALNTGGFDWNPPSQFKGPNVFVRIDHNFSQNDNLFGHFLIGSYNTTEGDFLNGRPQVYPGFPPLGEVNRDNQNFALKYSHVFSPTLVNEFIAGYNRFEFLFTFGESNPGFPDPTKNPPWADNCVIGSTKIVDSPYCGSAHTARAVTTPQFVDNVSWSHGAHNLRFGINFRFYMHNDSRGFFGTAITDPIITFSRSFRQAGLLNLPTGSGTSQPSSADLNTIQQAAVELLGIPGRIQQAFPADFVHNVYGNGLETVYTRAHQFDSYVQDEWHVRPNITVNAGLRWEFNPPPFDAKQTLVPNGDITSGNPVSFVPAGGWYKNNNLGAVGPRLGIAYSPDSKTSIRAGYGWMFDTISTFQVTAQAGKVPGFALNCVDSWSSTANAFTPSAGCVLPSGTTNRIAQGFPLSVPAPATTPSAALSQPAYQQNGIAPAVGAFDPNLKNPSIHEWNLTVQRELPGNFVTEVGYVGKRGTHLYRAYDLNQITPNPAFLSSFLVGQQNVKNGCNPDGTGCPTGVTGQSPTLLLQLAPAATLNNNKNDFLQNNVGDLATQIDQGNIVARGFPGNYFRPNPQFSQIFFQDSGGDSYYNAGFLGVRRRFEKGLTFGLSYTYSKSIDVQSIDPVGASTGGALSTTNSVTPTDFHNFALDRARSDFDNRHVLTVNMLYEFPIGQGKRFASSVPKWLDYVIGGWSYTGIYDYQSGEPYTLYSGSQTANTQHVSTALIEGPFDPGHLQFVPGITGPVMYNVGPLITNPTDPHFNCRNELNTQTYFCIPQPGQQGSGRNTAQGPDFWNLDSGLLKNFKLTERFNLQFRAEAFNVLNHPNFQNPRNASSGTPRVTTSLFGQTCCSTASLPSSATVIAIGEPNRVLQLGLKLNF